MLVVLASLAACRPEPSSRPSGDVGTLVDTGAASNGERAEHVAIPTYVSIQVTVTPPVGDPAGGGQRLVIEVNRSEGITSVTLDGVELGALTIDDETHVSGELPPRKDVGVVDLVVTNGAGPKTIPSAFEYWAPTQIAGVDAYLDAGKLVVASDKNAVDTWTDSVQGRSFERSGVQRPPVLAGSFGSVPAIHFGGQQVLQLADPVPLGQGSSIFAVVRWTATTADPSAVSGSNAPLTLVGDLSNATASFGASGGQIASYHLDDQGIRAVIRGAELNDGEPRLIGATIDGATTTKLFVGSNQVDLDDFAHPLDAGNMYDAIGAGWSVADGWSGDVGAVVIVAGEISVSDRTKLDLWAQQRFGTPPSEPLDSWHREWVGTLPPEWYPREGAQLVEAGPDADSHVVMIGGWNPSRPWFDEGDDQEVGEGDVQTNEVWASTDGGVDWTLALSHRSDPPDIGALKGFEMGHAVGVAIRESRALVIGSGPDLAPYTGDVWWGSVDGTRWSLVSDPKHPVPSVGRCLFMVGNIGEIIYLMGGQRDPDDATTGFADMWLSTDGGTSWEDALENHPKSAPPWSPRGMVYRPVELDGRLYIVGGGLSDATTPIAYNGVYAFDGEEWDTILEDGHTQFDASYDNALAVSGSRLWLFNGFTGTEELQRALYSDDYGDTWSELPGGSGGNASHGDAVIGLDDRVLRVSGNLNEREVWAFVQ